MNEDPLAQLRQDFVAKTALDMQVIHDAMAGLTAGTAVASLEAPLDRIMRTAHGLAGRGGTFGYPGITDAARPLEEAAEGVIATGGVLTADSLDQLTALVGALATVADVLPNTEPV